ncbi:hypothetical protein [Zoogloea sp.]|uniref:hypothetical protein n=1 Tax=Zoogloea sp. TaxID=49181 RepID=UPI0035AE7191
MRDFSSSVSSRAYELRKEIAEMVRPRIVEKAAELNDALWNGDGFYKAQLASLLLERGFLDPNAEKYFPVPVTCPSWGELVDINGTLCRPLIREAWVDVVTEVEVQKVFLKVYAVSAPSWLKKLRVFADEEQLLLCAHEERDGVHAMVWESSVAKKRKMIRLSCPAVCGVSPLWGRFSLVVAPLVYK